MKEMMRSKKAAIVDMTAGSPTALILGFAIPMLLGTLFQQFYSMADTVIVGRYLSINALAGVGSTAAINFLINGFVIGMSSGFAIPVAQRFGARDYTDMRKFIANTIWLSLIFSFVVTGLVAIFTKPLHHLPRDTDYLSLQRDGEPDSRPGRLEDTGVLLDSRIGHQHRPRLCDDCRIRLQCERPGACDRVLAGGLRYSVHLLYAEEVSVAPFCAAGA